MEHFGAAEKAALQSVGALFSPLRNPDDLAHFIDLEAALPEGMPLRNEHVAEGLLARGVAIPGGAWAVGELTSSMAQWPRLQALVARLRLASRAPADTIIFVSPAESCVCCAGPLRTPRSRLASTLEHHSQLILGVTESDGPESRNL